MTENSTVNGVATRVQQAPAPAPQEQIAALQDMVRSISAQRDAAINGQVQLDVQFAAYRRVAEKKIAELQAQLGDTTVAPAVASAVEGRVNKAPNARKTK